MASDSPPRRVTSADVARVAGVSRTTVSFVLNGEDRRISTETRARVLAVADELGFVPFAPARLLRGAASRLVLVITPELAGAPHEVGARIVSRLGERLAADGLDVIWQFGRAAARAALDLTPCVVLASPDESDPAFFALAKKFDVPVLPMFPGVTDFVGSAGGAQATYLLEQGHRALAFAAPDDPALREASDIRELAVREAVGSRGIGAVQRLTMSASRDNGAVALDDLLTRHPEVTGICAFDDQVALQVLAAAHDLRMDVPGRIAVIGVDDLPAASFAIPALTTVATAIDEFVEDLAKLVRARIEGSVGPVVRLPLTPHIVRRNSA